MHPLFLLLLSFLPSFLPFRILWEGDMGWWERAGVDVLPHAVMVAVMASA